MSLPADQSVSQEKEEGRRERRSEDSGISSSPSPPPSHTQVRPDQFQSKNSQKLIEVQKEGSVRVWRILCVVCLGRSEEIYAECRAPLVRSLDIVTRAYTVLMSS